MSPHNMLFEFFAKDEATKDEIETYVLDYLRAQETPKISGCP